MTVPSMISAKECYRFLKFNLLSKNREHFSILSICIKSNTAQLNIKWKIVHYCMHVYKAVAARKVSKPADNVAKKINLTWNVMQFERIYVIKF